MYARNPNILTQIQPVEQGYDNTGRGYNATYGHYDKHTTSLQSVPLGKTLRATKPNSGDFVKNIDGTVHNFSGTGTVSVLNWMDMDTALWSADVFAHFARVNGFGSNPAIKGVWGDNDAWSTEGYFFTGTNFNATAWDDGFVRHHQQLRADLPGAVIGGNDLSKMSEDPSRYRGTITDGWKQIGDAGLKEHVQYQLGTASRVDTLITGNQRFLSLKAIDGHQRYIMLGLDNTTATKDVRLALGTAVISGTYLWYYSGRSGNWAATYAYPGSANSIPEMGQSGNYGRNWLGKSIASPVQITSGVWARNFEHGAVIINATKSVQTVAGQTVPSHDAKFLTVNLPKS